MISAEITKFVENVPGWLYRGETRLLFELARKADTAGVIVEIGSWKGKSTICLAKGSEVGSRVKVYAIDPHVGSEEHQVDGKPVWTFDLFKQNIQNAKVGELVVPLVKPSVDAAKDFTLPVSVIFIDGAHDYDSVKADFEAWFPKVIEGGIIAFHDTTNCDGPRKYVHTALFGNPLISDANFTCSISYGTKNSKASGGARFKNQLRGVMKRIYNPLISIATHPAIKQTIYPLIGRAPKPTY